MEAPDRQEAEYELAAAILLLWMLFDGIRTTGPTAFEAFLNGFNQLVRPILTRIYGRARAALADSFGQPYTARPAPSGDVQTILIPGINRRVEQYAADLYETFARRQSADQEKRNAGEEPSELSPSDAERIAVTETTRIHSEGELDASRDIESRGGKRLRAVWRTELGSCPVCRPLEGTIREWRTKFPSGPPAHPHCLAKTVDVLTLRGWVPAADVQIGDHCLSLNTKSGEMEYQPVIAQVARYEHSIERLSSHDFHLECTLDHNMVWVSDWDSKKHPGKYRITTLRDMSSCGSIPRTGMWNHPGIERPDWYFCLMGWFLSEGSSTRNLASETCRIVISQVKPIGRRSISALLTHAGISFVTRKSGFSFTAPNSFVDWMGFDPKHRSYEKRLPADFHFWSRYQARLFLAAFCGGDGSVNHSQFAGYRRTQQLVHYSSSVFLRDGISELVLKAGKRPSHYRTSKKGNVVTFHNGEYTQNHDIWTVAECSAKHSRIETLARRTVEYNDTVHCVELAANHTLYVRQNGKYTWTGNCRCHLEWRKFLS